MALRAENRKVSADLIGQAISFDYKVNKSINVVKSTKKMLILQPYTVVEALLLIVNLKLSVDQYKTLRHGVKEKDANTYILPITVF